MHLEAPRMAGMKWHKVQSPSHSALYHVRSWCNASQASTCRL